MRILFSEIYIHILTFYTHSISYNILIQEYFLEALLYIFGIVCIFCEQISI